MSNMHGSKWIRPVKRKAIYMRDNHTCVYCKTDLSAAPTSACTLDHVIPRSQGGSNCHTNLVTACLSCNATRRDMPVELFTKGKGGMRRVRAAVSKKLNMVAARAYMASVKEAA